ncbi:MAG: hypothetical protein JWM44_1623 [Bacilli bacterium]|nr:hypothetical protein [Bacilli bacterium]
METHHNTRLTSTELASLWTQYMNETLDICIKKYILQHIEDTDIRTVVEQALSLSEEHVLKIKLFFNQEKYPIPIGFTEEDVNVNAPRLFSDIFWLKYFQVTSAHGLPNYALALTTSTRSDICDYYVQCNIETMDLYNKTLNVLLSKGLFIRPPYIPAPDHAEFVTDQGFLAGWFGHKRPLNGLEISHIFYNLEKTNMTKAILLGFCQVAKSKEIQDSLSRAFETAKKHSEIFESILEEDNLRIPALWESEITNSTIAPFSEKLMFFHATTFFNFAVFYYGAALSASMRRDLGAHYLSVIAKDLVIGEDFANILIKNGWLEKPPQSIDRKALTKI